MSFTVPHARLMPPVAPFRMRPSYAKDITVTVPPSGPHGRRDTRPGWWPLGGGDVRQIGGLCEVDVHGWRLVESVMDGAVGCDRVQRAGTFLR